MARVSASVLLALWPIAFAGAQKHPLLLQTSSVLCDTVVRFSPRGGVVDLLIDQIASGKRRLRIALYGLNNPKVTDALITAHRRGVDVSLKLDRLQSTGKGQAREIERLKAAGIKVEISELSRLLHNKFMVIDKRAVWTGSYNWTTDAEERHRENIVLMTCYVIAMLYEQEWESIEIKK